MEIRYEIFNMQRTSRWVCEIIFRVTIYSQCHILGAVKRVDVILGEEIFLCLLYPHTLVKNTDERIL